VLLAALELARRLAQLKVPPRKPMTRPGYVAAYLALRYFLQDQEILGAMFLDVRRRLIADREFFRGTLGNVTVEPRPVLKEGLLRGAAGIILFHTHPSGDPTPSHDDRSFTRRVDRAGRIVGLTLVDHLVVTADGRWCSMRDSGGW
jgi:DNA repair protein RadC